LFWIYFFNSNYFKFSSVNCWIEAHKFITVCQIWVESIYQKSDTFPLWRNCTTYLISSNNIWIMKEISFLNSVLRKDTNLIILLVSSLESLAWWLHFRGTHFNLQNPKTWKW
jgi:hypothetical protein